VSYLLHPYTYARAAQPCCRSNNSKCVSKLVYKRLCKRQLLSM
jgi:hypothetical protein